MSAITRILLMHICDDMKEVKGGCDFTPPSEISPRHLCQEQDEYRKQARNCVHGYITDMRNRYRSAFRHTFQSLYSTHISFSMLRYAVSIDESDPAITWSTFGWDTIPVNPLSDSKGEVMHVSTSAGSYAAFGFSGTHT